MIYAHRVKKIALVTAVAFFASIITAAAALAFNGDWHERDWGDSGQGPGKDAPHVGKTQESDKETKRMDGMKSGGMKGMKGM